MHIHAHNNNDNNNSPYLAYPVQRFQWLNPWGTICSSLHLSTIQRRFQYHQGGPLSSSNNNVSMHLWGDSPGRCPQQENNRQCSISFWRPSAFWEMHWLNHQVQCWAGLAVGYFFLFQLFFWRQDTERWKCFMMSVQWEVLRFENG